MNYEPRASAVHKSLLEIKTLGGVEKRMAIANGTLAAALTMGRYALMGDIYDPWPRRSIKRNPRPEGFGKNLLC